MREDVAFQVGAEFLFGELVVGGAGALQEGLQMLGEDLVQRMLFWLVAAA